MAACRSVAARVTSSPWTCSRSRRRDERLECLLVHLFALVEIDGAPYVPLEARVEQARRILQGAPLAKVIFTMLL